MANEAKADFSLASGVAPLVILCTVTVIFGFGMQSHEYVANGHAVDAYGHAAN